MTKIKKSELKNHLARSVNILKRSLSYTTYSYFILATLFFYHTGEVQTRLNGHSRIPLITSTGRSIGSTTFQRKKRDLQDELNEAFLEIEGGNPPLKDVLVPAIPTSGIADTELIEYRDQLNFLQEKTGVFSSTANFGQAYDYWITQLAKLTVKQGTSFYTPRSVIRLMVGVTKPSVGMAIYDPTAGTGGMFTESAAYIAQQGGDVRSVDFYGCETAPDIWAICKMNMLAHGLDNALIDQQDALQNNQDVSGRFDIVLQTLPLPVDNANKQHTRRANEAFLKHGLEGLATHGRGAMLMPSTLIQEDQRAFWQQVIARDWLEAVISLPAKLLHGTNAAATLIIFNKQKPDAHKGAVIFISAVNTALPYTRHNELEESDIQTAIKAFEEWKRIPEYANVISNAQIEEQDFKLGVEKYLHMNDTTAAPAFDIATSLKRYQLAVQERKVSVDRLMQSLSALNYPNKTD